jgi:hypothetical protein
MKYEITLLTKETTKPKNKKSIIYPKINQLVKIIKVFYCKNIIVLDSMN